MMSKIKRIGLLYLFFLLFCVIAQAQNTVVEGHIKEEGTKEPVMFANVLFKGTYTGASTDTTGFFRLTIPNSELVEYSLLVAILGYHSRKVPIRKGEKQCWTC